MKIWMFPDLCNRLEAADDYGRSVVRRYKPGDAVWCEIVKPRNPAMHRKFMALVGIVWQATGHWNTPKDLLYELKLELGIYHEVFMTSFGWVKIPGSISFASMEQHEFETFYEGAMLKLCELAGGIKRDTLRIAVLEDLTRNQPLLIGNA